MDLNDIVDPAFSLDLLQHTSSILEPDNYIQYIVFILVLVGGFITYYIYNRRNNNNNNNNMDCKGGFCTINNRKEG
jgi:hypothetical protein